MYIHRHFVLEQIVYAASLQAYPPRNTRNSLFQARYIINTLTPIYIQTAHLLFTINSLVRIQTDCLEWHLQDLPVYQFSEQAVGGHFQNLDL